ncbi:MAG: DUF2178 domain-containing protein [Methanosarcinaceae archaeon]|nr:DUF2178 domain-containing protein [Methanosarcinaceae archaeon]
MTKASDEKMYNIFRILSMVISVTGVLIGVLKNSLIIGFIGVGAGLVVLISAQKKYQLVLTDERLRQIKQRAGNLTFVIFLLAFALISLISNVPLFSEILASINAASMVSVIFFMMMYCYLGLYAYYKSKM